MGESGQGHSQSRHGRSARRRSAVAAVLVLVAGVATTQAFAASGPTTLDRQIVQGDEINPDFFDLETGPGSDLKVRDIDVPDPEEKRKNRRDSLSYFAQLTDFQLADEESPARVEFADGAASSAWRPQEALHPFAIDESIRRINSLNRSPFKQGDGDRAPMDLAVLTGDQADNQQFNETLWVRQLIEPDSKLDPSSGVNARTAQEYMDAGCDPAASQGAEMKDYGPEPNYIGVQDYREFERNENYYDPDRPAGPDFDNWPRFRGLMDRAQEPFRTTGLKVPSYVVNGNHDTLVQGNENADQAYENIVTGCFKATADPSPPAFPGDEESPNPEALLGLLPVSGQFVPPDPDRRFVSKGEVRSIFSDGTQKDDHGFAFVDPDEDGDDANRGNAWYYAWNPTNRLRFISIDTVSEGGNVEDSSQGNVDDPQFRWLESELEEATDEGDLVVVFGHHPIRSLRSITNDEQAPLCGGGYNNDEREYDGADRDPQPDHNHSVNVGCDPDVRNSQPLHGNDSLPGETIDDLFLRFPNVIAYVPGHTHENRITPFERESGDPGGFWELNTSAIADWPQQQRVIDLMDNRDGTLSIFSAVSDHASNVGIPGAGNAGGFNRAELGALGRNFSFNDPQSSRLTDPPSEGRPRDRNVELLLPDPREFTLANSRGKQEGEGEGEGDGSGEGGEEEVPAGPTGPTGPLGG